MYGVWRGSQAVLLLGGNGDLAATGFRGFRGDGGSVRTYDLIGAWGRGEMGGEGRGTGRRCGMAGCERAALAGATTCARHGRTAEGKALAKAVRSATNEALRVIG